MFRQFSEFSRGCAWLEDNFRERRSKSAVMLESSDAVRKPILQDFHVTHHEIQAHLSIKADL